MFHLELAEEAKEAEKDAENLPSGANWKPRRSSGA